MKLHSCLLAAILLAGLLSFSLCQPSCRLQDGKAGVAGIPGRDGWPGEKGEKGEAGLQVQLSKEALAALKGDEGEQGPIGEIGPKGYQGVLGPPGPAGPLGPSTTGAGNFGEGDAKKAAFSVLRTNKAYPSHNSPVTFDKEITNVNNDFTLRTGYFQCKVPGVYYFVFHSVSEENLCLKLKNDLSPDASLTFCDFNERKASQVVSGGAVLKLSKDNKVWLEPVKNLNPKVSAKEFNRMTTKTEVSTVFNGFLIFAT